MAGPTTSDIPPAERWQYVAMGDSTHQNAAAVFQAVLEDELGVDVESRNWINPDLPYHVGGERAADLVERLRTDEALRADLRDAEVITFVVPLGQFIDLCPFDPLTYQPAGTKEEMKECWPRFLAEYEEDVDAFFEELVAIRSPSDAVIRVIDNYQSFWEHLHGLGVYEVVRRYWQEANNTIHSAAAEHGIPVASAYDAINGPDGRIDGVAAGYVGEDQLHLSYAGAELVAQLLADLGFEPAAG